MPSVVASTQAQTVPSTIPGVVAPGRLHTTLYDVIAVLQTLVAPDDDDVVVAIVAHWLRSGRITLLADTTAAA